MDYAARYVFIKPSTAEILENRLKEHNVSSDVVEDILKRLPDQLQSATADGLYDTVIVGDNLEEAYESLRGFIYGAVVNGTATSGENAPGAAQADKDEPMPDVAGNAESEANGTNGHKA